MNPKKITITIIFAALTVALNPAISKIGFPAPYAPFLIYGVWEIPIVAAFLLIGPKSGIAISVLNALALFAFFPGPLPAGPFYNLIALLSTLTGVYLGYKLLSRGALKEKHTTMVIIAATVLAIILREVTMMPLNYFALQQPYPFGFEYDILVVLGFLPLGAIFNGTTVLYTVPIAYLITQTIKKNLKVNLD